MMDAYKTLQPLDPELAANFFEAVVSPDL